MPRKMDAIKHQYFVSTSYIKAVAANGDAGPDNLVRLGLPKTDLAMVNAEHG